MGDTSVFIVTAFLAVIIMIILFFTNLYAKHIYKGTIYWGIGSLFYFASLIIYILSDSIDSNITYIFGNSLVCIAMICFSHATNKLLSEKNQYKAQIFIYLITFFVMSIFKYFIPILEVRQFLMSSYVIYVVSNIVVSSMKFLSKDGLGFLIAHLVGSIGIIVLHVTRIVLIIIGKNGNSILNLTVSIDEIILSLVALLVVLTIVTMTIYINFKAVVELKNERHTLELASMTDFLTQLPNRRMLFSYLDNLVNKNKRFALIITDVDGFKNINDKYGHDIGDLVIQEFGKILVQFKRPHDFVARYGGDEFIIVIEEFTDEETLYKEVFKRITTIGNSIEVASVQFNINASVGISLFPNDGLDYTELIKKADKALYHVKSTGKNDVAFYKHIINQ